MVMPLEGSIITALLNTFGNPLNLGIFIMIFFVFLGLALKLEWEALMIIMIPSMVYLFISLADIQLNRMLLIVAIMLGFVLAFVLLKVMRR